MKKYFLGISELGLMAGEGGAGTASSLDDQDRLPLLRYFQIAYLIFQRYLTSLSF